MRWALRSSVRRHLVGAGLAGATVLVLLLRAPFASDLPYPDEGGLLVVARHWVGADYDGGPQLYGRVFVDRPPGLIAFYVLGELMGGVGALRWLGIAVVLVLVGAAARIGYLLGGRVGSSCTALTVAALACNPMLGTRAINAELVGAPLSLLSCLAALEAVRHDGRLTRRLLLVSAGVAAGCALLVKQNLIDGVVFGTTLLVMMAVTGRWSWRESMRRTTWVVVGVLLAWSPVLLWASLDGPGLWTMWDSLYGFRAQAAEVIASQDSAAPTRRLVTLPFIAIASGLLLVLALGAYRLRRRVGRRDPLGIALAALLLAELAGVLLGGSYWSHYLIGLLPGAAIVTALVMAGPRVRARLVVATVGVTVLSSVVTSAVAQLPDTPGDRREETALVHWLRAAKTPGDSAVVTWGHPELLRTTGLSPRSPLIWSLPQRALDPRLDRFHSILEGERRPTWVLVWDPIDSWGLDEGGRVHLTVARHYRFVREVCGVGVYLRRELTRPLPPLPTDCVPDT